MPRKDGRPRSLPAFQPLGDGVYRVGGISRDAITGRYKRSVDKDASEEENEEHEGD